ncbi:MAG: hypothetical protein RLZZ77_993 [Bacteroidota bacterium]
MKNLFKFLLVVALSSTVLTSCKEDDPCEGVSCLNGGTCVDGNCDCDAGFEGTDCGTQMRTKFIASYAVSEACTSGNYTYDMTISTSATSASSVIIDNFGGVGISATGTVNGKTLTIPNATSDVGGVSVTYQGSGQINGNILTMSYSLTYNGTTDPCTSTCTKQ